jgi:hypothetical protein
MFPFMATMRDIVRVFPIRGGEDDVAQLGASYFKALRRYPLALVQEGAQRVIAQNKHFPKPAEWLDAIPRASATTTVEALSAFDAGEWLTAERGRWEQAPCKCAECRTAGMLERKQRFVPEIDANGADRRGLIGDRLVTRGHWIHGHELARWYAAKDQFWGLFRGAVKAMGVAREPGMEG